MLAATLMAGPGAVVLTSVLAMITIAAVDEKFVPAASGRNPSFQSQTDKNFLHRSGEIAADDSKSKATIRSDEFWKLPNDYGRRFKMELSKPARYLRSVRALASLPFPETGSPTLKNLMPKEQRLALGFHGKNELKIPYFTGRPSSKASKKNLASLARLGYIGERGRYCNDPKHTHQPSESPFLLQWKVNSFRNKISNILNAAMQNIKSYLKRTNDGDCVETRGSGGSGKVTCHRVRGAQIDENFVE